MSMNYAVARPLTVSPSALILGSVISLQLGTSLAKDLFQATGLESMVLMRVGFAALILMILHRPQSYQKALSRLGILLILGLALASMNLLFYNSIARIPIGIASAIEFLGPLGLAIIGSTRLLDLVWVGLAGTGILLLTPLTGVTLNLMGLILALLSAACWATSIKMTARVGEAFPGGEGLAWALGFSTIMTLPLGIGQMGKVISDPHLLVMGLVIAILSSAIPYSLELKALRSLPVKVFGVLLSLEPVAAALSGWFVLGETLNLQSMIAIGLITLGASGASQFRSSSEDNLSSQSRHEEDPSPSIKPDVTSMMSEA